MGNELQWTVFAGPRIYNLFPLLAGALTHWQPHLERARRMEFDWLFVNPIQLSGRSGSIYSISDYYALDPRFIDPDGSPPMEQLRAMLASAQTLGLKPMIDLVINHTAADSPLVRAHPEWYRRGADGVPVHPGAREKNRWVVWKDLAEIDNSPRPEAASLWSFWIEAARYWASLGFRGFRCDAAYKVPPALWERLIADVSKSHPNTLFFAESLGCTLEETRRLTRCGFAYIFNSAKWWDFSAPWCLEQYRETAPFPSVSFPESHDTRRLAAELGGDVRAIKMRYAFAALFSSSVMMPIGFEYGFRHRLHVVKSRPEDWETPRFDLCDYVAGINRLKMSRRVFNEEGPIQTIDLGNSELFAFVKSALGGSERALVILNKDRTAEQSFAFERLQGLAAAAFEDLSPEGRLQTSADHRFGTLAPAAVHVFSLRSH